MTTHQATPVASPPSSPTSPPPPVPGPRPAAVARVAGSSQGDEHIAKAITEQEATAMTRKERCALLCALVAADDLDDAPALARLGWTLFDLLCRAQQAQCDAVETLGELRTAARAVVIGDGSHDSVRQVRDVLFQHGWLP